eukprot:8558779-Pyramimonas_sp.AAC.1
MGREFIVGADWNMGPEVLEASDFGKKLRASTIVPEGHTHFPSKGPPERFDVVVVSEALSLCLKSVFVEGDSNVSPHRP